jgi:hypothetical protein
VKVRFGGYSLDSYIQQGMKEWQVPGLALVIVLEQPADPGGDHEQDAAAQADPSLPAGFRVLQQLCDDGGSDHSEGDGGELGQLCAR